MTTAATPERLWPISYAPTRRKVCDATPNSGPTCSTAQSTKAHRRCCSASFFRRAETNDSCRQSENLRPPHPSHAAGDAATLPPSRAHVQSALFEEEIYAQEP